jgi:hypothetical protein
MWASFDERLRAVLAQDDAAVRRLSKAGTSVAFSRESAPDSAVTLLLDRRPPALAEGGDAQIRIAFTDDAGDRFARGELVVSTALLEGEAQATGPVRRYLAVDPVLRGLLRGGAP